MSEDKAPTWAICELMGHVRMAGRLSEEEKFGSKLGRLDIPTDEGHRTVYFGGASVYKITLVTEAVARHVARTDPALPVSPWDFPKALTHRSEEELPPGHPDEDDLDDEEERE